MAATSEATMSFAERILDLRVGGWLFFTAVYINVRVSKAGRLLEPYSSE
jgi:hypothetical protein